MIKIVFTKASHWCGVTDSPRVPADDVIVLHSGRVEVADVPHARAARAARIDEETAKPLLRSGWALRHEESDRRTVRIGVIQRYQDRAAVQTLTARLPVEPLLLVTSESFARRRLGKAFGLHRRNRLERPTVCWQLRSRPGDWSR